MADHRISIIHIVQTADVNRWLSGEALPDVNYTCQVAQREGLMSTTQMLKRIMVNYYVYHCEVAQQRGFS